MPIDIVPRVVIISATCGPSGTVRGTSGEGIAGGGFHGAGGVLTHVPVTRSFPVVPMCLIAKP